MDNIEKMSVAELVATEEYRSNLDKVIEDVCGSRLKLANEARIRDRKLKRHPFDRLLEKDMMNVDKVSELFIAILDKKADLPAMERDVVENIGMEALNRTIREQVKANPSLLDHKKKILRKG
jgi:hypothetical protein